MKTAPAVPSRCDPVAVRAQLERIVSSSSFHKASRSTDFLRYVVDETLEGRDQQLKEYSIAASVFKRDGSYDTQVDSAVRVEAGKIRARLQRYYETEGRYDRIRIGIPKGAYVPVFEEMRADPPPQVAPLGAARSRRVLVFVCAIGCLAAAVTLAIRMRVTTPAPNPVSLAVLPFVDMSAAQDQSYFCDGLTEEIINAVSRRVPRVRVAARTSVFLFKGTAADVRDIGRRLRVDHVLEGSVRRDGGQARVAAQLIKVSDGYPIWSDIFTPGVKGMFAVQEEIAGAIVSRLQVPGRSAIGAGGVSSGARNNDAWTAMQQGRHLRALGTTEGKRLSIEHLKKAVALDPQYAMAHAELAYSGALLAEGDGVARPEVLRNVAEHARQAMELDPGNPVAYRASAMARLFGDRDWAGAERDFRRAIELNPSDVQSRSAYARICLLPRGRFEEAIEQYRAALDLDPLSGVPNAQLGSAYVKAGRLNLAVEELRRAIDLRPGNHGAFVHLGITESLKGNHDQAIVLFRTALDARPGYVWAMAHLGFLYGRLGRRAEAEAIIAGMKALPGQPVLEWDLAGVYAGLGDFHTAFDLLERADERRVLDLMWLKVDHRFSNLQSDQRFTLLAKRLNLQ